MADDEIPRPPATGALRIGWATPWNHRSAIAQSACEVAFELNRRGHAVTVLRSEVGEALALPPRPVPGPIFDLADCTPYDLRENFDVVVAHIGDHYNFHGAIPQRLGDTKVVGIFHDAFIVNLANGWLDGDDVAIRALLRQTYGEDTLPAGEPFWLDVVDASRRRPMVEWLARRMAGAVAHAEHYAPRLRDACPGPVAVIPLAFTTPDLPPAPPRDDRVMVGVIGTPNPNKRVDQLIMAIAASPVLRQRCRIRIIGEATAAARDHLGGLAEAVGVTTPQFTGWVTDDDLRWQLRDVDVVSCLRNPVLEGASASLILAQCSGRPTLVSDHGCYAEVPPDTVLSCAPDHEARDVIAHLERLAADPSAASETGRRAREFARRRHTPAAYVDKLLPLLADVAARQGQAR